MRCQDGIGGGAEDTQLHTLHHVNRNIKQAREILSTHMPLEPQGAPTQCHRRGEQICDDAILIPMYHDRRGCPIRRRRFGRPMRRHIAEGHVRENIPRRIDQPQSVEYAVVEQGTCQQLRCLLGRDSLAKTAV